MKCGSHLFRIIVCLVLCCSLIFSCLHIKTEATAAFVPVLIYGAIAVMLLFSVGVVIQVQNDSQLKAIGENFQNHMIDWGKSTGKEEIVDIWLEEVVVDLAYGSNGNPESRTLLFNAVNAAITLWIYEFITGLDFIIDPGPDNSITQQGYIGFSGLAQENIGYHQFLSLINSCDFPFWDFLKLARYRNEAMILSCGSSEMLGYFFDDYDMLRLAIWENPFGSGLAKYCGLHPLDTLVLKATFDNNTNVFGSKESAMKHPNYSSIGLYVIDWENVGSLLTKGAYSSFTFPAHIKRAGDEIFTSTANCTFDWAVSTPSGDFSRQDYKNIMSAWTGIIPEEVIVSPELILGNIADDVISGDLSQEDIPVMDMDVSMVFPGTTAPLEGVQQIGQLMGSGDLTLDEYRDMVSVGSTAAEKPVFAVNLPFNSSITYYKNATASPITVIATVPEGCSLTYSWYRYGIDSNGKPYAPDVLSYSNSFTPPTSTLGTTYYYCKVTNTTPDNLVAYNYSSAIEIVVIDGTAPDSGSDADSSVDDEEKIVAGVTGAWNNSIKQSLQDLLDNVFKQNTSNKQEDDEKQGGVYVDQITGMVPDYSKDILPPVRNLANSLGYTGTTCILTMPAITVPSVGNLFPETRLLDEQSINFEDFFNKMPPVLLSIVRAVFDITVVIFCAREVIGLFQSSFTGFKKSKGDNDE